MKNKADNSMKKQLKYTKAEIVTIALVWLFTISLICIVCLKISIYLHN